MSTIITAYNKPDLDGVASAYAYAEFLERQARESTVAFSGKLQSEAFFISDFLKIQFANIDEALAEDDEVILVDASEADMLSDKISLDKVVELIDHRQVNSANLFKNAKIQIELVGSCATLITEKFIEKNLNPSKESAILLYCAIVSNTINFKASVTTDRDHAAANYLLGLNVIPAGIAYKMFKYKSNIDDPIALIFPDNLKSDVQGGKRVSIFQIEIIGVDEFIKNNFEAIVEFLLKTNSDNSFDHTFLTCIDIEKGENTFICPNAQTQKMLSDIFSVKFENNIAKYNKIIMRKEIKPLIKQYLEVQENEGR
jgi:inorganic pyrophosphatase/exopolyphosphatase